MFKQLLLIAVVLFAIANCGKDNGNENPFENETDLDCRNLKVRKVEYVGHLINRLPTIHVTIENTCKACEDSWVYLGLFMIDKSTNDTVAQTCGTCLGVVRNKNLGTYELETQLSALPDLNNIRFDYSYICHDVAFDPR